MPSAVAGKKSDLKIVPCSDRDLDIAVGRPNQTWADVLQVGKLVESRPGNEAERLVSTVPISTTDTRRGRVLDIDLRLFITMGSISHRFSSRLAVRG